MTDDEYYRVNKAEYLQAWSRVLAIMLGWSEDRVMQWARLYGRLLDGGDEGLFYHETPIYYVAPLLLPETLKRRLDGLQQIQLCGRIQSAIQQGDSFCDLNPDHDWHAAKERVEKILSAYGERLPTS
jgi:hypothetical protein